MAGQLLSSKLKKTPFLIMSHRGFWGGNVIENTIEAAILAYKAGADIVEVDVCRTSDNVYYTFHDGSEPKLLLRSENFKELRAEEVDNSTVYNSIGSPSGHKINTLIQFLDWLPEDKLVNIDRSWEYWDDSDFFKIIKDSGKEKQLIFKSPVNRQYLEQFSEKGAGLSYVPIVHSRKEAESVLSITDIRTVGLELIISDFNSELLSESWVKRLEDKGLMTVVNSENLGSEFNLLGGFTDDVALIENKSWDKIVELGIHVIQTDWPNFMSDYRENLK